MDFWVFKNKWTLYEKTGRVETVEKSVGIFRIRKWKAKSSFSYGYLSYSLTASISMFFNDFQTNF